MNSHIQKIEDFVASLLPDNQVRKLCLSVLLESVIEANKYGPSKWGVYYIPDADRLRLLIGSMIVLTIQKQGVWMALDQELLQQSKEDLDILNRFEDWHWDNGRWSQYVRVPSRNGYYLPSEDHLRLWPVIRRYHFAYVKKVANKFSQLRKDSQQKHMPQVLLYLQHVLNQDVPNPVYGDFADSLSNPINEIQEYQLTDEYKHLSHTERESIIQSRVGQGQFRAKLIRYWKKRCAVTNCQRIEILKASHIKPWRESNNEERLDVFNGLLLVPNLDAAFDNGLISFTDDGQIMVSDLLAESDRSILGIQPNMKITKIDERHRKYLKYHRENVFKRLGANNSFT